MAKKNSALLWGGLALLGILLMSNTSGAAGSDAAPAIDIFIPWVNQYNYSTLAITMLHQALTALWSIGYRGTKLKLALAQVMYETGVFSNSSIAAMDDNNFSGILWINNPSIQKNATQGSPADSAGNYWAHFAMIQDWAIDYDRIVNLPPYMPIDNATDPSTFALLLQENGYYTGSEANYAAGLTRYYNELSSVGL